MEKIINELVSFSQAHDLWNLTKKYALECIKNFELEEKQNNTNELNGLTTDHIILEKKSQKLIFWQFENNTFIVRTEYALYPDDRKIFSFGEYALDIDLEGNIVDDWFIIY